MDPSVDQEWPVDEGLRGADRYVFVVTCLYLVPKVLVFHPVLMALQLPALLLARCRVWSFVAPTFKVDRSTCGHRAYVAAAFLLALPALLVVIISYLLDMVAYYAFSILYCAATCKWKQYGDSCRALQPYRGGPTVCSMGDFFVCMLGATWRQGALEATFMLASMWSVIPWMKSFVNANPFVYPREERFVQQISTSMQDVSLDDLTSGIDEIIVSRGKVGHETGRVAVRTALPVPTAVAALCVGRSSGWLERPRAQILAHALDALGMPAWRRHGAPYQVNQLHEALDARHAVAQQPVPFLYGLGRGEHLDGRAVAVGQGAWRRAPDVDSHLPLALALLQVRVLAHALIRRRILR